MADPTFALTATAFLARHLAALLLLAATSYALGRLLTRGLAWSDPLERLVVGSALGLAALGGLGLLLGSMGRLARGPLVITLAAIHLLAWRVWRQAGADLRTRLRGAADLPPRRLGLVLPAAILAALAPLLLLALYPPTAFDATMYHLPFARAFARTGRLPWMPWLRVPVFPQLSEVLFAEMLLLAGDVATHLVELLAALLTAALLLVWGRALASPAAGRLAAAAYLGNPLVVFLAGTAFIDTGLALFATASLYALGRRLAGAGRGWLVLAAAFAGAAAASKYLGLLCVVVGGLALLAGRRRAPRLAITDLAVFAAVALAALAPWYGRILFYTGNPVFPFLPGVFGGSPWQPRRESGLLGGYPSEALAGWGASLADRLGTALTRLASLPWDWSFRRAAVGSTPAVSPAYLAALPALAWAAARERAGRRPLVVALAWMVAFLGLPPDARYLVPALALLSLVLGIALDRLLAALPLRSPAMRRRLLAAAALGLVLPGILFAWLRIARQGPLPVTAEGRERYLAARLPAYPALRHLNRTHGGRYRLYGLFTENMKYFAQGDMLGDWSGPAPFDQVAPLVRDPVRLHRELEALGIDHLLIRLLPAERGGVRLPDGPAARRRFRLEYADRSARVYALL